MQSKDGLRKNLWSVPGGFVNSDELINEAAEREVLEETGLKVNYIFKKKNFIG